jgi:hypothetical protein
MKYVTEVSSTSIVHCNIIDSILHSYEVASHIQILAHEVGMLTEVTYGFSRPPLQICRCHFQTGTD